ncbi:sodium/calcium exchanger membrane region, Calcium binding protein 2 [Artemisia annua]|uniref:Sodium/calcium exchanger membrane region, Calcium binding protein 2 n=1 Tax=Artemisia annua TaxID=35608 RepID=A0A2U1Q479_ARTAN|nr:sodium/calcium exchanger membrane region, Calcium binding protein 2 [Artemisia annua]
MRKVVARIAQYSAIILILLVVNAGGRLLHYDDVESVSDGLARQHEESFLRFKGMDSSKEQCQQMYGFLPCSSNLPGHIFLIVIYEYLLYQGESYAGGDGRIFHVFGKNFIVSILSQLLESLPEFLILLVSGLLSSNEETQEYVVTGVGLLAGSSILLLTVLWGICLICAQKTYVKADSRANNNLLQLLTGSGIHVDSETCDHAKIMLFSVIPLIIILIPRAFGVSYSSQVYNFVALLSLFIALFSLCCYFYFQYKYKRIHDRILEYAELEKKIEMHVPYYEVQALMRKRDKHLMEKQIEMEVKLQPPKDGNIIVFDINTFSEWIDSTRRLMDDPYTDNKKTEFNQVITEKLRYTTSNLFTGGTRKRIKVAQLLRQDKIKFTKLVKDMAGGNQDEHSINKLFDLIRNNKDSSISRSDLKAFIQKQYYKDQKIQDITDELVDIIMGHLDGDSNGKIEREEFESRANKWLKEIDTYDHYATAIEMLLLLIIIQKTDYEIATTKASKDGRFKAIALLVLGILMLTVLVEPLTQSVRIFSESMKIAPFYVSFILVPLATNARTAIAAIIAAKQKRHYITSLTFSQIYHKVFMNNILGFSVLVSVIYFRGLTWHFSAEVLVLVIVCVLIGLYASFSTTFPIWTLFLVFPLYPLSLILVYYVDDTFTFT